MNGPDLEDYFVSVAVPLMCTLSLKGQVMWRAPVHPIPFT